MEAAETADPAEAEAAAMAEETRADKEQDTHPQTPPSPVSEKGKKIPTRERKQKR